MNIFNLLNSKKSIFWNSIIFISIVTGLVVANMLTIFFLKDIDGSTDIKVFTIDSPQLLAGGIEYAGVANQGVNTNPLLFSFIEISKLPIWASYVVSLFLIIALSSSVFFIKSKWNIAFISILVATLGCNVATLVQTGVAERNIYISWLFGLSMNFLDFIFLLSIPVFVIYWIILFTLWIIVFNKNTESRKEAKEAKKNKVVEKPEEDFMPLEGEVISTSNEPLDMPVFKQERKQKIV